MLGLHWGRGIGEQIWGWVHGATSCEKEIMEKIPESHLKRICQIFALLSLSLPRTCCELSFQLLAEGVVLGI
jgi:hypothetical protein